MRVYVIDSHPVSREGIKSILSTSKDMKIVGEAGDCSGRLQDISGTCDVVTLDGELESFTLLESLGKSRPRGRPPYTLVLTRHKEDRHAIQMLAAGADGYLDKTSAPELILDAIRKISRGGKYVTGELAETVLFDLNRMRGPKKLSKREYQVLYLLASGLGMTEIAGRLTLSIKTVSTYRSRLLEKLNLTNNAQLMRYAFKEGLIGEE